MRQVVDEIIESIAHAAVDAELWHQVLDQISHHFPGTKVVMHSEDGALSRNIGLIYCGTHDKLMRDYTAHFASINPWMQTFLQMPRMLAAITDDLLPAASFDKSEFYCDFIRPEGGFNHASGVKIFHESSRLTMLSAHMGIARLTATMPS